MVGRHVISSGSRHQPQKYPRYALRPEDDRSIRAQASRISSRPGGRRREWEPDRGRRSTWDPALTMLAALSAGVGIIGIVLVFVVHLLDHLQSTLSHIPH